MDSTQFEYKNTKEKKNPTHIAILQTRFKNYHTPGVSYAAFESINTSDSITVVNHAVLVMIESDNTSFHHTCENDHIMVVNLNTPDQIQSHL